MPWIQIAGLAIGVVSSLFGAKKSGEAASTANALGARNADYITDETEEKKRRLKLEHEQTKGTAKTSIAGSGFRSGEKTMGGSHKSYLANLKATQTSEMDWLTKSGKSRSEIARMGGNSTAAQMQAQAFGQYARAGQGLFSIANEIKNG